MGKQSRRESRRNRPLGRRRKTVIGPGRSGGLKLVVATSPVDADGKRLLEHDLQMVRAALLYADTVELVSPVTNLIAGVAQLHAGGAGAFIDLLLSLDDEVLNYLGFDGDVAEIRESLTRYRTVASMPRSQRRALLGKEYGSLQDVRAELDRMLAADDGPRQQLEAILEESGAAELAEAIESDALMVNWEAFGDASDTDQMVDQFAAFLGTLLESADAHVLLDEHMSGMARSMIAEGLATPPDLTLTRAARSRVGVGLVESLPAFPNATVTSILEVRHDLAAPLAAYRGGVSRISDRLRAGPFDRALSSEVDDIWRDEVAPAVENLRNDLSKTRLMREALHSVPTDAAAMAVGTGLFFGVQSMDRFDDLVAAGFGATPVLGRAVMSAVKDAAGRREAARRHEFFYLLELNERL